MGPNTSNQISANSFEDDTAKNNNSGSNQKQGSKGVIMFEKSRNIDALGSNDQMPAPVPFETSAESIKMDDIDFYKLSMIAGGGVDQKMELNSESIKEVVQQQVQAALQQQQDAAKNNQSEFLKNL